MWEQCIIIIIIIIILLKNVIIIIIKTQSNSKIPQKLSMRWTRLATFVDSLSKLSRLSTSQGCRRHDHHHHKN